MSSTKQNPRVLILTASVGAGHNQAARALIEALAASAPHARVERVDVMEWAPRWFRAYYAGGFALAMTRLPRAYGLGFWFYDRPHAPRRGLIERVRLAYEWRAMARLRRHLVERQPELIVHTHFLAPPIVGRLMRQRQLACRQAVVLTDIIPHRWWYSREVAQWFAPQEDSTRRLRLWGIDPARITHSGMPILAKWTQPLDREKIYADWKLPRDKKIVLLTGGTEFTCGPVVRIAAEILQRRSDACVVVLAGRNKQLLADLTALGHPAERLTPVPFTDRGQELLEVCSLMITKPGGITTAECLAKGTPMVLLRPVPGQEGLNAEFLQRHGAAAIARRFADVAPTVADLLSDPARLAHMAAGAKTLFRYGTPTIAEWIARNA